MKNWSPQNTGRPNALSAPVGSRNFSTTRRRSQQGGFILLVIFMMTAAVAIMLYAQLPRVAFESEREKEQLLIDRGEQYTRAIQLFYASTGGYPQSIAALEDTNNKRFLRRRYKDPYTGKEEWRLIHSNGTQLTDSLVQKPPDVNGQPATTTTTTQNGNNPQDQGPQVNAATLQRPSDRTLPGSESFNGQPNQFPQQLPNGGQNNQQQTFNGQPANQVPGFGLPGGLPNGIGLPGGGQTSGASNPAQNNQQGFQPQFPGQQFPGQQFPGQAPLPGTNNPVTGQTNNVNRTGQPVQTGTTGFQQQFPGQQFVGQQFPGQAPPPGFQIGQNGQLVPVGNSITSQQPALLPGQQYAGQPLTGQYDQTTQRSSIPGAVQPPGLPGVPGSGAPGSTAVNLINQILTTPRANPIAAASNSSLGTSVGGIAGVASTFTGPSIKTYKDRTKYQEWEFVYTPTQGVGGAGGATAVRPPGTGGTTPGGPGNPGRPNVPGIPGSNPGGSGFPGSTGGGFPFPSTGAFGGGATAPTGTGGFPVGR